MLMRSLLTMYDNSRCTDALIPRLWLSSFAESLKLNSTILIPSIRPKFEAENSHSSVDVLCHLVSGHHAKKNAMEINNKCSCPLYCNVLYSKGGLKCIMTS